MNSKTRLIAVVAVLPLLLGATSKACAPEKHAAPGGKTINQDDGEHRFHSYGRFKFGKTLAPHGAGAACQWRLEAQFKGEKGRHRIDNGTETEKIYVPEPANPDTTKVWLISKSCGKWE